MTRIVAQRELAGGRQEIVAVDIERGVTDVLVRPTSEWTFQAPKTLPDGAIMVYRLRPGQQFNIASDVNELVIFDGPDFAARTVPRPVQTKGLDRTTWTRHGHATPTSHDTLIHAAQETTYWWIWPIPTRQQWACVETDLSGKPTGARWEQQAEPSWTTQGLTRISTAGTGSIVTPTRSFDKASAPIGAKSFGWFDPHLSPDGSTVVWLDLVSVGIGVVSGLILGNITDGRMRYIVTPTVQMQTDAMWLDNRTLVGSRFIDGHWNLVGIDVPTGGSWTIPNTVDCTAAHVAIDV